MSLITVNFGSNDTPLTLREKDILNIYGTSIVYSQGVKEMTVKTNLSHQKLIELWNQAKTSGVNP